MDTKVLAAGLSVAFVAVIGLTLLNSPSPDFNFDSQEVDTFGSEEEFRSFIAETEGGSSASYSSHESTETRTDELNAETGTEADASGDGGDAVAREKIVEPETVVEDGKSIYYSSRHPEHLHVVSTDLDLEFNRSDIGGELLLTEDMVISIDDNITAYSKGDMSEEWSLETDSRLETVRKSGDTLTVVTRERVDSDSPCPVKPAVGVEIACSSIYYHPGSGVDYTYNILKLDVETGETEETAAFTADRSTETEVTSDSVYVSYSDRTPESEIMTQMLMQSDTADQELRDRIQEIQSYNLSERSRQIEIERAVEQLASREGQDVMEELEQEGDEYDQENMRDYEVSHVLRFDEDLEQEELEVEGHVTEMTELNDSITLNSEIRGVSYSNRMQDLHLMKNFEVVETHRNFSSNLYNVEAIGDGVLVETRDGLVKLDSSLEKVGEYSKDIRSHEVSGDRIVLLEGDRYYRTRGDEEHNMERKVKVLDSDLAEVYSENIEDRHFYSLGTPVEVGGRTVLPASGINSSLIEVDEGIEFVELDERPGRLLSINDSLYIVNRDSILKKDLEYETVNSIELAREYDRPRVKPMVER